MPEQVSMEKSDEFKGKFTFKPHERGYGVTIGNSLRRVLLSSLEGYAITSIKVPGVLHEFSNIEGVVEDMLELVLKLKQIRFKKIAEHTGDKVLISIRGHEVFKAGDIAEFTSAFQIMNPDLVICHLSPSAHMELEISIEKGRGYVAAEENKPDNAATGIIPIDAIFTPVKNVKYRVEDFRVEQKTDYEKLIIDLQTDGTIYPEKALVYAAQLMIKHFLLFSDDKITLEEDDKTLEVINEEPLRIRRLLKTPLTDLELSVRAFNCLKSAGVETLGDLAKLEVAEMVKFRNFGKKSLKELEELMASKKLNFGMDVSKYKLDKG